MTDPNHDADCPSRDGFYPENCECSHAPWRRPVSGGTSPLQSFAALGGLLAVVAGTDRDRLTPRQQQGLRGAEACIMLGAHSGKLDAEDLAILAKAGLVFGAVLAGER